MTTLLRFCYQTFDKSLPTHFAICMIALHTKQVYILICTYLRFSGLLACCGSRWWLLRVCRQFSPNDDDFYLSHSSAAPAGDKNCVCWRTLTTSPQTTVIRRPLVRVVRFDQIFSLEYLFAQNLNNFACLVVLTHHKNIVLYVLHHDASSSVVCIV